MADLLTLKKFEALSPFEIKNELIELAKVTSKTTQSAFLNAGRILSVSVSGGLGVFRWRH